MKNISINIFASYKQIMSGRASDPFGKLKITQVSQVKLDVPKDYITIDIESGMSGPLLQKACEILKGLFYDKAVDMLDKLLQQAAKDKFPAMIEQLLAHESVKENNILNNLFESNPGDHRRGISCETTMKFTIA